MTQPHHLIHDNWLNWNWHFRKHTMKNTKVDAPLHLIVRTTDNGCFFKIFCFISFSRFCTLLRLCFLDCFSCSSLSLSLSSSAEKNTSSYLDKTYYFWKLQKDLITTMTSMMSLGNINLFYMTLPSLTSIILIYLAQSCNRVYFL